MEQFVYVGTYTGPGRAEGIYVYRYNPEKGVLTHAHTVRGVDSPSFLALDRDQRHLYAVNERSGQQGQQGQQGEHTGGVSAFAVDQQTGNLTLLNTHPTRGNAPCYVSVDPSGRCVLVANYSTGSVAVFPIQRDGSLDEMSDFVQHEGRSTNPRRQEGPHAHSILPTPDGRYVLSCDLGIDRVLIYTLDAEQGKLSPSQIPFAQVNSGAGPRHLAFHPNGRLVLVNGEIDSSLAVFAYDADRGALQIVDAISSLPEGVYGPSIRNSTAHVTVHPNGRFAYVSNRGHDSLAIYAIDPESGRVRLVGHQSTGGQTPRGFNLDPAARFLLAANQNSGTVVSFAVDGDTGRLTPTGHVTDVPWPVCVTFTR